MYREKLFRRPKKTILERDQRGIFAFVLLKMDLGNVVHGKDKFSFE